MKYMIANNMAIYESISLIENVFHITYIQNRGAAFSIFSGERWTLIGITSVFIVLAILFLLKKRKAGNRVMLVGVSCIIGGGIGNLIDRALNGYVVDYFDFRVFPVFNIADIAVTVGCGLLLIYVIFLDGKENGKRDKI